MLIRLLATIDDWGDGTLAVGLELVADTKIAPLWIAQGKAERIYGQ